MACNTTLTKSNYAKILAAARKSANLLGNL